MTDSLFSRVKSLPPLPESIIKIQQICNDPNASIAELTKVVERDPMITASLLKAANSPLYGFAREIKTLSQAISLFGMATVRGFALASTVKSTVSIDMSPYGITAERFADLSQLQNALMVRWYTTIDRSRLEVLSPASFLIGVGRVIISQEIIKEKLEGKFKEATERLNNHEAAEEELFALNYEEISAAVFRHWRFEDLMVDAIAGTSDISKVDDNTRPYAIALRVVQDAVSIQGITEDTIKKAAQTLNDANMPTDKFKTIANELIS